MSSLSRESVDGIEDYCLDNLSDPFVDDYDDPFVPLHFNGNVPTFDIGANRSMDDLFEKPLRNETNRTPDFALNTMGADYYAETYVKCSMYDKSIFYTLQAEILVLKRRYKEALSAALVAEEISGPAKVLDAVKMICMYQMNDDVRFKELKERLLSTGFSGLSETLKQQAIGTIQVSNFIPEFLDCLDRMKSN